MPRDVPRATDSAVGRAEGDGIGPRNVTLTGFRGSRGPWAPRGGPGETDSAVGRAEGDMARRPRFPLAALHAGRGAKRPEGDIPRVRPCRPRWLSRQTRRERCQGIRALARACLPCGLPRQAWHETGRGRAGTSPSRPLAAVGSRGCRGAGRGRRARTRACLPCGLPRQAWHETGRGRAGASPPRPSAAAGCGGCHGMARGGRILA